jgi:transmembrane sensor
MAELERETLRRVAARHGRKRRRNLALAASFLVAVVAGLTTVDGVRHELGYWRDSALYALAGDSLYRTAIGEQRKIALHDGTVVTLNTDSRAAVQYGEDTRAMTLLWGQALFEVARDESRPFVVTAGDRRITALGTAFDVRLSRDQLQVILIEGRVAIDENEPAAQPETPAPTPSPASGGGPEREPPYAGRSAPLASLGLTPHVVLDPGEQFLATAAIPEPVIREVDVRLATSWRDGQLIFRNDRLAKAVNEVNRYSKRKIVLTDETLGDIRVSGIVNTGNTAVFVETMVNYYPVEIVDQGRRRVILGPRRG